jgi:kumamolisin
MADAVALPGSAFHPTWTTRSGHRRIRDLTATEERVQMELTVLLRERPSGPAAETEDRRRVTEWARTAGIDPIGEDPATRRLTLRGAGGRLAEAFGVRLERFSAEHAGAPIEYRGHRGPVMLPAAIAGRVTGVFGLDDRRVARPQLRSLDDRAALAAYDPADLARLYRYPRLPADGEGAEIVAGMIELGGVTHAADVALAFARLGLHAPEIVNVWIDGATPASDPDGADVEVALDYQVIAGMILAVAPRARLTVVAYNAPNSERGFIDAVATAASDAQHRPSAVSISWGAPEDAWSLQAMLGMDAAFAAGAERGVTYSAAAGDAGSTNAEPDGRQHAEFPAASPNAWACGGTAVLAAGGRITREVVWNELGVGAGAAGSGVSRVFPVPAYQWRAGIRPRSADDGAPGRGLPDGCGNADPRTGWNVVAQRRLRVTGGTSAVAPMYTALWSLISARRGAGIGLPHPAVYAARGLGFNDVVSGSTGGPYAAGPGWDLASGWGSPDGVRLAQHLERALRSPEAPELEAG